jgi:hypothetical protein
MNLDKGFSYPDPPRKKEQKKPAPFGAKTIRVDSTLETTPPTLFLDPDSQSGSKHFMYYLNCCIVMNKVS